MKSDEKYIVYITHEDSKYGAAKSILSVIKGLKNTEYLPIVITCKYNDYNILCNNERIENYIVNYKRCTCSERDSKYISTLKRLRYKVINRIALNRLCNLLENKQIVLIHTNTTVMDIGMYLSDKLNVPHVWHVREFLDLDFDQKFYNRYQIQKMSNSNSCFLCISNAIRNHWAAKSLRGDLRVIYNGVSFETGVNRAARNDGLVKLIFAGHITKKKGQEQLIDAIGKLPIEKQRILRVDFWGTGDEQYVSSLKKKIDDMQLSDTISFCGFTNNIIGVLGNYDIGIVASKAEGFGRVTVEYMLAGLCVIASNTGANIEIIQSKENGLLYEYGSPDDLAEKLLLLLDNPDYIYRLAALGKTTAINNFSEDRYIKDCLRVYTELISNDHK